MNKRSEDKFFFSVLFKITMITNQILLFNSVNWKFFFSINQTESYTQTWGSSTSWLMPPPFASKITRTRTISRTFTNANTTSATIWRKSSSYKQIVWFSDHVVMVVVAVVRVLVVTVVGLVILLVVVIVGVVEVLVMVIGVVVRIVKMLVVVIVVVGVVVMGVIVGLLVAIKTFSSVLLQLRWL